MARPSKYTVKIRDKICVRLSGGESLRSICNDKDMPVVSTVLLWVVENREGFSEHYARSREAQAHFHVDEMLDMRHGVLDGTIEPQAARVVADMIKWSAERMGKKAFNAKAQESEEIEITDNKKTIRVTRAVRDDS